MEKKRTKENTGFLRKDTMNSVLDPGETRKSLAKTCNKFSGSSPSSFIQKDKKLNEMLEINFNRTNSGFLSTGKSHYIH